MYEEIGMAAEENKFHFLDRITELRALVTANTTPDVTQWIDGKLHKIISETSTKELYLTYSLLASKLSANKPLESYDGGSVGAYLKEHHANALELGRLYLLVHVLEKDDAFVTPVLHIIQIADKEELITFLKYLIILPGAARFKTAAVEALRTNIATVFDAIALHNPYPQMYFNEQEWNQMYLKAVFIQRQLEDIQGIDERANEDLARIISDYAHERWAASRPINPYFWRPVTHFLEGILLDDMRRLLNSTDSSDQKAGALCCYHSRNHMANVLLHEYPELVERIKTKKLSWETIND
ncbi:EboA domain-containing protein [Arenibacter sp. GZD96]|uniref:EboA domain-containing protein n=1 Tax=Aurantibrevibacter litoralis TaxID=3106030 RepID=UPI002AFDF86E|nr:EboA domain-containing protein [Arenibacter sp. GZD-96]MEA1785992.1 EboA domain-containing protein [Arenibacter sp. GZD-96]